MKGMTPETQVDAQITELHILSMSSSVDTSIHRFAGEVSLDLVDGNLIIRDTDGGCVRIKPEQIEDLQKYINHAKERF